MQRLVLVVAIVAAAVLGFGCAEEPEITELEAGAVAESGAAAEPEMSDMPGMMEEAGPVEVAAEGTVYDPPIDPERLPEGVWYCDMGTTHYAQTEQGDGTCPVCAMQLVEKSAPIEPPMEPTEG